MTNNPFRGVNRRAAGAAAVTAVLLVPLGVFGAPALARSGAAAASHHQYSGSSQYQYKITICHRTHSKKHPFVQIRVSVNAWKGHKHHHGDTLGPCPSVPAPAAPTQHGKGKGHDKGDDQGASNDVHGNSQGNGSSQGHGKGHDK